MEQTNIKNNTTNEVNNQVSHIDSHGVVISNYERELNAKMG